MRSEYRIFGSARSDVALCFPSQEKTLFSPVENLRAASVATTLSAKKLPSFSSNSFESILDSVLLQAAPLASQRPGSVRLGEGGESAASPENGGCGGNRHARRTVPDLPFLPWIRQYLGFFL
jgi:hypothetical protein